MTINIIDPQILVPFMLFAIGWIISVERRISKLQRLTDDIHAIRNLLEAIKREVPVRSLFKG